MTFDENTTLRSFFLINVELHSPYSRVQMTDSSTFLSNPVAIVVKIFKPLWFLVPGEKYI